MYGTTGLNKGPSIAYATEGGDPPRTQSKGESRCPAFIQKSACCGSDGDEVVVVEIPGELEDEEIDRSHGAAPEVVEGALVEDDDDPAAKGKEPMKRSLPSKDPTKGKEPDVKREIYDQADYDATRSSDRPAQGSSDRTAPRDAARTKKANPVAQAWGTKKEYSKTREENTLEKFDSPRTKELQKICEDFEARLRETLPPGKIEHLAKAFGVGVICFAPYAARTTLLNYLNNEKYDPLTAAAYGAVLAGFIDAVDNKTFVPLLIQGAANSPHLDALQKQWSVGANKCRDLLAGVPNHQEYPLAARQYFAAQARVFFSEHLPFYSFILSNALLHAYGTFEKDDAQWQATAVNISVGFLMSGISVMALQMVRASYPSKFFKPTLVGQYARNQVAALESRKKDLEEARNSATGPGKIEVEKQLKKTGKMLEQAKASVTMVGYMTQGFKNMFTRPGVAEWSTRILCLMPPALMLSAAAAYTSDPNAVPVIATYVVGQMGFGARNEIAAVCEAMLSIPQGAWAGIKRCMAEEDTVTGVPRTDVQSESSSSRSSHHGSVEVSEVHDDETPEPEFKKEIPLPSIRDSDSEDDDEGGKEGTSSTTNQVRDVRTNVGVDAPEEQDDGASKSRSEKAADPVESSGSDSGQSRDRGVEKDN